MRGMTPNHVKVCHFETAAARRTLSTAVSATSCSCTATATRTVVTSSAGDEPRQFTLQIGRSEARCPLEQSTGSLLVVVRVSGVRAAPPPQRGLIYASAFIWIGGSVVTARRRRRKREFSITLSFVAL